MNYINNINENNNINNKDNFIINNKLYSNSMIEPKINQNILDPYPNNLNYKYKNNTPFNTNSNQDEYKYSLNNNNINNIFEKMINRNKNSLSYDKNKNNEHNKISSTYIKKYKLKTYKSPKMKEIKGIEIDSNNKNNEIPRHLLEKNMAKKNI